MLKKERDNQFMQRIKELEDKDRERSKAVPLIPNPLENKQLRKSAVSKINDKILEFNSARR